MSSLHILLLILVTFNTFISIELYLIRKEALKHLNDCKNLLDNVERTRM